MGASVQVAPAILDAAARACADLNDRVQAGNRNVAPESEAAAAGIPGWQTARALSTLAAAWSDDVKEHTTYLAKLGDALAGCATDYRTTDHATAARFDIDRPAAAR